MGDGGLLACLTEMALGGDIGFQADLSGMGDLRTDHKLFSESSTRWVVEATKSKSEKLLDMLPAFRLGKTVKDKSCRFIDGDGEFTLDLIKAREAWSNAVERE